MDVTTLSQWQFALTSVYHFFFVPLTLGLSVLVAVMETLYVSTGNAVYKTMTKFWGKLFLINFSMGVVTGIVQEFQFGMNWSNYSRFVGDIFGAPLAIEALLAFFLESTFLGVWIFGWEKLSKKLHLAAIWLVAIGSNLSALWILIANSFMQHPQGYAIENGRAVMSDFGALVFNPYVWTQFPHTVLGGFTTGAFFIIGISAYHLARKQHTEVFQRSFSLASIFGVIAVVLVGLVGHSQAQAMIRVQPMKMAAAEALWETEDPASMSVFTIAIQKEQRDLVDLRVPYVLSLLAHNRLDGKVLGINELQAEYEQAYGAGNYIPPITILYWSFRAMVGAGMLMVVIAAYGVYVSLRNRWQKNKVSLLRFLPFAVALPYLANTTGWILTEMGRQPWVVVGLMKTADAASPVLTPGMVLTSLLLLALLYAALMAADIYLLVKFAKAGPTLEGKPVITDEPYME